MSAIHIFKAGTHTDMHGTKLPFTQSDLAACVKAYDPSVHEAPLVIGHPKTEDPAWGWVKSLSLSGADLLAEHEQATGVSRKFPPRSISLTHPITRNPARFTFATSVFWGRSLPLLRG